MLHLVLGTVGSGKSEYILEQIAARARSGGLAILLVPEQFSFESERRLQAMLADTPGAALRVSVLSFTRLCNQIFYAYGGLAGQYLSDTSRRILMSVALEECRDRLQLYAGQAGNAGFLTVMLGLLRELKNAGVSPQRLRSCGECCTDRRLREKLGELALIYETYQALVERSYLDPDDDLERACERLEANGGSLFADTAVYFDGFTAFMAGEYRMISLILAHAPEVWAAFGTGSISAVPEEDNSFFAPVNQTARRFLRMAREYGVTPAVPVRLGGHPRFRTPALSYLEANLMRPGSAPFSGEPDGVRVVEAANRYEEIDFVATEICRLTRQEGVRYREIAVIARDISAYAGILEERFARSGIACYLDRRADIAATPLAGLLLGALAAVRGSFDTEQILRIAKNPALGFAVEEVALLENYCYVWSVAGAGWEAPFANHPQGMKEALSEADRQTLASINRLREALIAPLGRLREALRGADGAGFARALYEYLEAVQAAEHLRAYVETLRELPEYIELNAAVWDALMQILDTFASAVGPVRLPLPRLAELFELAVQEMDVGTLPQTLDQVIAGSADRIRPNAPRVTFVLGAVEGEFPAAFGDSGVLGEAEREQLAGQGLELGVPGREQLLLEQYYGYFAVTTPSQRLYLCYSRAKLTGEALSPSVLVRETQRLFGEKALLKAGERPALERITDTPTAFSAFCACAREDSPFAASLRDYLLGTDYAGRVQQLLEGEGRAFALRDRAAAEALFGHDMRLSPSRVERYYGCPFAYFCASGLQLQPRRRVEFTPLESGSVIHHLLERLLSKYDCHALAERSDGQLREEIAGVLQEYLSERVAQAEALPARFQYLFSRLIGTLLRLLRQLTAEFLQSDFSPCAFELPIARGAAVEPIELELISGGRVWVEGVVDRVDLMEKNGKKYVRVVDYKSGGKEFRLSDIYYGLNMQMLLYLFSIWQGGKERLAGTLPAGVLYMPARSTVVSASREASDEEIAAAHGKTYRMNGLLLDDPEAVCGMEREAAGVFIPVRRKKDGSFDAASSLATLSQMGLLKRRIETLITGMANSLQEGKIPACPAAGQGYDPCGWCDYRSVCLPDEQLQRREICNLPPQELYERIEEEEEDGR